MDERFYYFCGKIGDDDKLQKSCFGFDNDILHIRRYGSGLEQSRN